MLQYVISYVAMSGLPQFLLFDYAIPAFLPPRASPFAYFSMGIKLLDAFPNDSFP